MIARANLYWICQFGGWGLFVLGNVVIAVIDGESQLGLALVSMLTILAGIGLTHGLRHFIHKWKWSGMGLGPMIPRVFISALVLGLAFVVLNTVLSDILTGRAPFTGSPSIRYFVLNVLNFSVVFLFWEIIYFAIKTFRNWKNEEITNLELRAAKTEIELTSFKTQLNPHFIFNSLNSIRALVDEDPDKAKKAITMLSGILRNNLMLGKNRTVTLGEELDLVEKYLSIEKIRFEERLQVRITAEPGTLSSEIPPFMLQTLVENGIKHGISRRKEGGVLELNISADDSSLVISICNSGKYNPSPGHEGIGIANTRKRLDLMYGDRAKFSIFGKDDLVHTQLIIPQHLK
jgi:two-component system, LytTR family, sensor kinase